jgi:uncharacterized protein YjgD (DUF1641 family)
MTLAATEQDLASQVEALNDKVDRLTLMLERQEAARGVVGELMTDSAPIVRSAYEQVAATLHDRNIDAAQLGDLVLRLAEAAPDLNRALQMFQGLTTLVDDVAPLAGEGFGLVTNGLDELDRRGYFTFAKGGLEVIDRIVTSFDEDDIRALGENVELIFQTVKEMTQPEVMLMLQRSFSMVREEEEPKKLSMFRLMREMRDPEVKLGIHRMLLMLRGMASLGATDANTNEISEEEN